MEKQYIRGNVQSPMTECKNCGKKVVKNDPKQIVFFCSKACRKEFKKNNEVIHDSPKYSQREFKIIK